MWRLFIKHWLACKECTEFCDYFTKAAWTLWACHRECMKVNGNKVWLYRQLRRIKIKGWLLIFTYTSQLQLTVKLTLSSEGNTWYVKICDNHQKVPSQALFLLQVFCFALRIGGDLAWKYNSYNRKSAVPNLICFVKVSSLQCHESLHQMLVALMFYPKVCPCLLPGLADLKMFNL